MVRLVYQKWIPSQEILDNMNDAFCDSDYEYFRYFSICDETKPSVHADFGLPVQVQGTSKERRIGHIMLKLKLK